MESIFDWLEPTEAGLFDVSDGADRLRDVLRIHRAGERPDLDGCVAAIIGVMDRRGSLDGAQTDRAAEWVRGKLYGLTTMDRWALVADLGNIVAGPTESDTRAALDVVPGAHGPGHRPARGGRIASPDRADVRRICSAGPPHQRGQRRRRTRLRRGSRRKWMAAIGSTPSSCPKADTSSISPSWATSATSQMETPSNSWSACTSTPSVWADCGGTWPRQSPSCGTPISSALTWAPCAPRIIPASPESRPNGLTGEEFCQLARYAGYSDRLTAIGFFEHDPSRDGDGRGGQLLAEAIWCFLEGVMHRIGDHPRGSTADYLQYRVVLEDEDHEVVFYKSPRSDRWWMDIPTPGAGNRKGRLLLIPCTYADYQAAATGHLPDRWWRTQQKLA